MMSSESGENGERENGPESSVGDDGSTEIEYWKLGNGMGNLFIEKGKNDKSWEKVEEDDPGTWSLLHLLVSSRPSSRDSHVLLRLPTAIIIPAGTYNCSFDFPPN